MKRIQLSKTNPNLNLKNSLLEFIDYNKQYAQVCIILNVDTTGIATVFVDGKKCQVDIAYLENNLYVYVI